MFFCCFFFKLFTNIFQDTWTHSILWPTLNSSVQESLWNVRKKLVLTMIPSEVFSSKYILSYYRGYTELLCLGSVLLVCSPYVEYSSTFGFAEGLARQQGDTLFWLFHYAMQKPAEGGGGCFFQKENLGKEKARELLHCQRDNQSHQGIWNTRRFWEMLEMNRSDN